MGNPSAEAGFEHSPDYRGLVDLWLNRYYGTSLTPLEFSILTVRMPFGPRRSPKFAGLRGEFDVTRFSCTG